MTVAVQHPAPPEHPAPPTHPAPRHSRMGGVLRSEWTKLHSVRSTAWSLAAMLLLSIGISILVANSQAGDYAHAGPIDRLTFDPTSISLTGLLFGQLAIGVLGALAMSAEYGTGTIRATLSAVPNRLLVLIGKTAVFAAVALVVGEVLSFATFFIGQAVLSSRAPTTTLGAPGVLRAVTGGGLYLTLLGLLALGIATIVRHTAAAITAFVTVVLILPLVLMAFPHSIQDRVGKFLPANIGTAVLTVRPGFHDFPTFAPWTGMAILGGYTLAALVMGAWVLLRRDA